MLRDYIRPFTGRSFASCNIPIILRNCVALLLNASQIKKLDVVAGPSTGGIILAFETARQLGVRSIFAEEEGEIRVFRRDFDIAPGEHVLIVDDILTTGGSIRETMSAVDRFGGVIVGVGVLVDRRQEGVDFGVPLFSCLRAPTITYSAEECPLCAAHIPLTKPGGQG